MGVHYVKVQDGNFGAVPLLSVEEQAAQGWVMVTLAGGLIDDITFPPPGVEVQGAEHWDYDIEGLLPAEIEQEPARYGINPEGHVFARGTWFRDASGSGAHIAGTPDGPRLYRAEVAWTSYGQHLVRASSAEEAEQVAQDLACPLPAACQEYSVEGVTEVCPACQAEPADCACPARSERAKDRESEKGATSA
ncbi:MAG TPA: hypothetical protein VL359_19895 [bacterium]|nr:hypothetical protein [bacterium]